MTDSLAGIRYFLVDMDGVLFRGDSALPGAGDFLGYLHAAGLGVMLLTNNSTLTPADNAHKLAELGIPVDEGDILTSSGATAEYLSENGARGGRAVAIGERGLISALALVGIEPVTDPWSADWVVTGLDRSVTYDKLRVACLAVGTGARWVATNADTSLPVEEGLVPGAGAIQAAITAATSERPLVIGKPEPRMLNLAMARLGATADDTVVVGDRLDTDIESAVRAGLRSVMVLTGVSTAEDVRRSPAKPTVVLEGLPELLTLLRRHS